VLPSIRLYETSDWPELCSVHDAARLDELRLSVGEDAFLSLSETADSEGLFDGTVVVATNQVNVIGFASFTPDELTWLYVHPEHYRQGVGRALVSYILDHSSSALTVELLEGNAPALRLYESLGFQVIERKSGRLEGHEAFAAVGLILRHPGLVRD
jgi:ribosomal protein S18 acetylase RimI-like enzyme